MSFDEFKNKGNTQFKAGDFVQAIKYYDECILLNPEDPVPYSNKAMSLIKLGRYDAAIRVCNVGLSKVKADDASHDVIKKKIEYRLNMARQALKGTGTTGKVSHAKSHILESIPIQEVDTLPLEFSKL